MSSSEDSTDTRVAQSDDLRNKKFRNDGSDMAQSPMQPLSTVNDTDPINKIETSPTDNIDGPAQSRRKPDRKVWIHHRHKRNVPRRFTPENAMKHLKPHKRTNKKDESDVEAQTEDDETAPSTFWQNIAIMLTTFPYWNMAFWSGWCYSIGSIMFIIDGLFSWVPIAFPETEFSGEEKWAVPLLFFFGACLYQIGGVMAYLEAINDGCFAGSAMKRLLKDHQDIEKELLDAKLHVFFGHLIPHHHDDDGNDEEHETPADPDAGWKTLTKEGSTPEDIYNETKEKVERRGGVDEGGEERGQMTGYMKWQWYPTWNALKTYHIYELGYVACTIQLFGVTLYGVTSVVILPGIFDSLAWWQEIAAYWVPQVVASCCFLIASIMFTIMAQDKWNKPKWGAVSWWIGIWAQIGSVGFL